MNIAALFIAYFGTKDTQFHPATGSWRGQYLSRPLTHQLHANNRNQLQFLLVCQICLYISISSCSYIAVHVFAIVWLQQYCICQHNNSRDHNARGNNTMQIAQGRRKWKRHVADLTRNVQVNWSSRSNGLFFKKFITPFVHDWCLNEFYRLGQCQHGVTVNQHCAHGIVRVCYYRIWEIQIECAYSSGHSICLLCCLHVWFIAIKSCI